jgi:putative endonuclease
MSFFVYMLGCADGDGVRTYVGWTTEPERRLAEHNGGAGARSTRGRWWTMIHLEEHPTRQAAMSREWHLKRDRRTRRELVAAWHRSGLAPAATVRNP